MELADVRCLAVLGLRRSGLPAALLARRELSQARVAGLDEGGAPDDAVAELRAAGVEVLLGAAAKLPADADLLVKSPGVPNESPVVRQALAQGAALWSEVEFATRFLPNPLIGITGTNGKTTTTELTGQIFRDAGLPVAVGGNIGYALAAMPGQVAPEAVIVAELSSFQLEHIERFHPSVALLLNLTEDHVDRHGSYRAYLDAKLRVFALQRPGELALLNADDPETAAEAAAGRIAGKGRRAWFSSRAGLEHAPDGSPLVAGVDASGALWLDLEALGAAGAGEAAGGRAVLCTAAELALRGDHNLQNSLAAAAAACACGAPAAAAAQTLRTFAGVPHRLQVAGVVVGVIYVNDSKATNVDATLKALTAYSGGVHLILGGYDKGAEYDALAVACEGRIRQALLIGATGPQLEAAFAARAAAAGSRPVPTAMCGDLETAVQRAAAEAVPGDVVLLSPACASWDQYRDYVERGEHFLRLVSELENGSTTSS
jgi:UDP-N-acetylmuramoylalanine--D-glutamate ligase